MTDILREVDEAMRVEKLNKLWQEHGPVVITGIAALILGTAAHSGWNAWIHKQKSETTSALITALDSSKPLEQLETLAGQDEGSHRYLTLMTAAAQAMTEKKYDEAVKFYGEIAEERKAPAVFRDLAVVQKVNITLDQSPDAKAKDLIDALAPVAADKKSPWQGQALMTQAVVKAHKSNDFQGAVADLKQVTTRDDLPTSLRQRAQALIDTYQAKTEGK